MPDQFTLLLEWRRNEASVRSLSKLPIDLYPTTTAYLGELKRSYEVDLRENPSGRKGEIARQTYQRASQVARDILESRTQKLLSIAFQASIGGSRDLANAVPEERAVFDRLLTALLEHRRAVAPFLETAASPGAPAPHAPSSPAPAAKSSAPSPSSPAPRPRAAPPSRTSIGGALVYVRVLKDGAPIAVGPDTVDLRADDVVSLPPETAKLLVDAKIAEMLTTTALRPVT
jgi:DNA replication initiation complex subunit (GINS family)